MRGCPRQRLRQQNPSRPPGPRSCQMARCPRTPPRPFRRPLCPSWRAGHEPEDVAPVRSSPRTPSFRDGELVDQGQRPPAGHSRRHNQLSGEFVAQGQRRPRHRPGGISLLMEWWTIHHRGALQSLARDARRSHRSVEGDEKPHKMRERQRQTATKPRYYIRGIEITAQTGLGRTGGGGGASPSTSATRIMPFTWASVVPAGTVPKDYPRHFDDLSARPVAPVSRRSPRNRAHRGHRA